jgi:SAM-dependent methyltransferase
MEKLRSDAKISPQRVTIACEFTLKPEYEEQFRRWLPFYRPHDWVGKRFVDVGCGMGRNSYWPMSYGAAGGVAIDVDERSLAAARRNLAPFPTVEV